MKEQYKIIFESFSPDDTKRFASELWSKEINSPCVIALYGDLGAGKTVFASGIADALNIREPIISPTFTIIREYQVPDHTGLSVNNKVENLFHIDMYRLTDYDDTTGIEFEEYISSDNAVCIIEWPEIVEHILPKNRIKIEILHDTFSSRIIKVH